MAVVYIPQEPMKHVLGPRSPMLQPSLSELAYGNLDVTATPTGHWVKTVDLSSAREFGSLRILYPPGQLNEAVAYRVDRLLEGMRDFGPEDYVLAVGPPSLIMIAGTVAALLNDGWHRMLEWDRRNKKYRSEILDYRGKTYGEIKLRSV